MLHELHCAHHGRRSPIRLQPGRCSRSNWPRCTTVLSSLAKFKAAFGASLAPASSIVLDAILSHPITVQLTDGSKKGLRNTLMHYIPRSSAVTLQALDRPPIWPGGSVLPEC